MIYNDFAARILRRQFRTVVAGVRYPSAMADLHLSSVTLALRRVQIAKGNKSF